MKKKIKYLSQSGVFTKVVLPIILVAILAVIGWLTFRNPSTAGELSIEEARVQTEEFINTYLMTPGTTATIEEIEEIYGLYKIQVDISTDIVESFVTKDGKVFFPQAFYVEEMQAESNGSDQSAPPVSVDIPKTSKPSVELFVMSHCPYGTQIEKGILPVITALGDKIDFDLKFVDYAMHGEVEIVEQTLQHCIQKEQEDKLVPYLECFLVDGETEPCLAEANVDTAKADACVAATDAQYKIMENFNNNVGFKGSYPGFDIDKASNTKYSVQGSPTLIVNETEVPSGRDPQSLLTAICGAFDNAPVECSTSLSSATPAPGFGTGTTNAASASAECN